MTTRDGELDKVEWFFLNYFVLTDRRQGISVCFTVFVVKWIWMICALSAEFAEKHTRGGRGGFYWMTLRSRRAFSPRAQRLISGLPPKLLPCMNGKR